MTDSWLTTVGYAGAHHHTLTDRPILNLYYRFDPDFWGHGYATEAVTAVVEWARAHYPDVPLVARVATNNHSSIALAARLGLTLHDELRDPTDPTEHLVFTSSGTWPPA